MTAPCLLYTPARTNVLRALNDHLRDEIEGVQAEIADLDAKRADRLAYLDVLQNIARAAGIRTASEAAA